MGTGHGGTECLIPRARRLQGIFPGRVEQHLPVWEQSKGTRARASPCEMRVCALGLKYFPKLQPWRLQLRYCIISSCWMGFP